MQPLDPRSRNTILASSAVCFLGAIAFSPLSARSADPTVANDIVLRHVRASAPATLAPLRAVLPRRDPFVASRDESDMPADGMTAAAPAIARNIVRPQVDPIPPVPALPPSDGRTGGNPGDPLPPNAGARDTAVVLGASISPSAQTPPGIVRAVIVGDHPYAVIEEGQTTRVLGIGGTLGGKRIVSIDLTGVTVDGGEHFPVTKATPAAPTDDAANAAENKRRIIVLPPGYKYEAPGVATPPADASAKPTDAGAPAPRLAPSEYQSYNAIQPPAGTGVPLQPLPTQFGYGQPSFGQPGYQPPAPAPSASPGPTFGQTF